MLTGFTFAGALIGATGAVPGTAEVEAEVSVAAGGGDDCSVGVLDEIFIVVEATVESLATSSTTPAVASSVVTGGTLVDEGAPSGGGAVEFDAAVATAGAGSHQLNMDCRMDGAATGAPRAATVVSDVGAVAGASGVTVGWVASAAFGVWSEGVAVMTCGSSLKLFLLL